MNRHLNLIESDAAQVQPSAPSLSWLCAFCGRIRIYEGGSPTVFAHLDTCIACENRVAVSAEDRATHQAAIEAMIFKHLT